MIQIRERAGVVNLHVRVQPGAKHSEITGEWQGAVRIRLAAPAREGEANRALQRWIAARLQVPMGAVRIAQGERSRSKVVEIHGVTAQQVQALLLDSVADSAITVQAT
jgi:uncharacterized protein (TIGR00251 family)